MGGIRGIMYIIQREWGLEFLGIKKRKGKNLKIGLLGVSVRLCSHRSAGTSKCLDKGLSTYI